MTKTSFLGQVSLATKHIKKTATFTLAASILGSSAFYSPSSQAVELDSERSLFIRDVAILERFTLTETLQKLINDSGDFGQTPQSMLDNWTDSRTAGCSGTGMFNGFVSGCISGHGDAIEYKTLALTNRFDLATEDGSDCGEYRVAFGMAELNPISQTHIQRFAIFESRLMNPNPQSGLEGCRPVVDFWADLSNIDNISERADHLHDFYFNGLPGFTPIVDVNNYRGGENNSGQIRFNHRSTGRKGTMSWGFSEFRLASFPGQLSVMRSTVKDTPPSNFLSNNANIQDTPDNVLQDFENAVIEGLMVPGKNLLANSMSTLGFDPADTINSSSAFANRTDALDGFRNLKVDFDPQSELANNIQSQLDAVDSNLTPVQVIARVDALSCAGCHSQAADLGAPINFISKGQNVEMLTQFTEPGESIHVEAESFNQMSGVKIGTNTDSDDGQSVGWLDTNDWMVFNVALPASSTGEYRVYFRVSGMFEGELALEQPGGSQTWDTVTISPTGDWESYQTITRTVQIPAGQTGFAIAVKQGGWNINWIEIQSTGGAKMHLKDVLKNRFIPERKIILENFLNSTCSEPSCLDTDNDGVKDDIDQCTNTSEGTVVDEIGCLVITGGNCDGVTTYPNWLHNDYEGGANTHIKAGELMQHENQLFQANWYASSLPGSDGSWSALGSCD